MNFFIIFLILLPFSLAHEFVAGHSERNPRGNFDVAAACANSPDWSSYCATSPSCELNSKIVMCYNRTALPPEDCPETTSYCNMKTGQIGTCSLYPDTSCNNPNACQGTGFFPDPNNCARYYYCYFDSALNEVISVAKTCPTGSSFNPAGPDDRKCMVDGKCVTAACSRGKIAEWVPLNYKNFTRDRLALHCINSQAIRVEGCQPGLSIDINTGHTRDCIFVCRRDNKKAVYQLDVTKFRICRGGEELVESCDDGKVFDGYTLSCIDDDRYA